jgi:hypothetical protein
LTFGNYWYNNYAGTTVNPQAQWGGNPNNVATGGWYTSQANIDYQYYYPGSYKSAGFAYGLSSTVETSNGGGLAINHVYKNGQTLYGTGYNNGMTFTG